jgi:Zn finger protein HypA/HybF involved in hydrogenase expression
MAEIKKVEVQCKHCKQWGPSQIGFGDTQSFKSSQLSGNMQQCPHCGKMTPANKENMRWTASDGETYKGSDTT